MKRLNVQLFVVALLTLITGTFIVAGTVYEYQHFRKIPPLTNSIATVALLRDLYFVCEFRYVPCLGVGFIVLSVLLLYNWRRRLKIEASESDERSQI